MEKYIEGINKYIWHARAITYNDYGKIVNRIKDDIGKDQFSPDGLHTLYLLASNSRKHDSRSIPIDVVTINSEILLIGERGNKRCVKIVFPQHMESFDDISVYSPLGVACLGAKEQDIITVKNKDSEERYIIDKIIFQPERSKAFHL